MRKSILQLELQPGESSVDGVRKKLGLEAHQIDADFGVRVVREESNQYAVRVDVDVAQRVRGEHAGAPGGGDVRVALVH